MPREQRDREIRLPSGLRLHFIEQGERDGPVVLLLHGYADSSFSYSRLAPLLPMHWRVLTPDHRGHGESDRPADGYTVDQLTEDALAFMAALAIERAFIVGHSMGSFIGMRMAVRAPTRVAKLVLIGTAPVLRNEAVLGLWNEVKLFGDTVSPDDARAFQTSMIRRPVPTAFMERAIAKSLELPAHAWKALCEDFLRDDSPARLKGIACPTLVLGGDCDIVFSAAEHEDLARRIANANVKIYSGVGHCPNWEVPDDVAADLIAFLD